MRIFVYAGLIEIMFLIFFWTNANRRSRAGVMALSSGYLWTSVLHVQALEVLAWDKDAGLQEVSSTGWFESSALAGRGRLISVTSALFLVSVPKPGRVFAAQYIRKTRLKEMQEISLCISPVVVLTVFSWKCPSHTLQSLNLLPWHPQATEVQGIQHAYSPLWEGFGTLQSRQDQELSKTRACEGKESLVARLCPPPPGEHPGRLWGSGGASPCSLRLPGMPSSPWLGPDSAALGRAQTPNNDAEVVQTAPCCSPRAAVGQGLDNLPFSVGNPLLGCWHTLWQAPENVVQRAASPLPSLPLWHSFSAFAWHFVPQKKKQRVGFSRKASGAQLTGCLPLCGVGYF